ncbi:hypothetical protein BC835DRAFT_1421040 [Cytidiella melzeri]|nr:hypothetical protein BC835DRAFT_1421040 [Cytidiella melzeri]
MFTRLPQIKAKEQGPGVARVAYSAGNQSLEFIAATTLSLANVDFPVGDRDISILPSIPSRAINFQPGLINTGQHTEALVPDLKELRIHTGTFRSAAISLMQNIVFLLRVTKWKADFVKVGDFKHDLPLPYFSLVHDSELVDTFKLVIVELFGETSEITNIGMDAVRGLIDAATVADVESALGEAQSFNVMALTHLIADYPAYFVKERAEDYFAMPTEGDDHQGPNAAKNQEQETEDGPLPLSYFSIVTDPTQDRLSIKWPSRFGDHFLPAISAIIAQLRIEKRNPTFADYVAFHVGYYMLSQGLNPFDPFKACFLGTVGFRRDTQTYCSMTDPGDGHVFGTTRKRRWMKGAIVHVEHLERPAGQGRAAIESYRIPSTLDFARVRLHTGDTSPNTIFIGRPFRDSTDGQFEKDFVKLVGTISATTTGIFQLGAAECKIALDGLHTSQMVKYMHALAGNALRNHRQYLSAAFNLNSTFVDDLEKAQDGTLRIREQPVIIEVPRPTQGNLSELQTIRRYIALRAVELAALGGFDKVTVDGASDDYPSKCLIDQLGFQNCLEFVHEAHSVGLTTYMSAGFKFEHIPAAVYSGVDGIGIGGAQILRYMDHESGYHGPYTEERIDEIYTKRGNAASSTRGKGALLLARLDQMYYEGSITKNGQPLREKLYQALLKAGEVDEKNEPILKHEGAVLQILEDEGEAEAVLLLGDDGEQPWLGRANRILRRNDPLLRQAALTLPDGEEKWARFKERLEALVAARDEHAIFAFSLHAPWSEFRRVYHALHNPGKSVHGETRLVLKITPPEIPHADDPVSEGGSWCRLMR